MPLAYTLSPNSTRTAFGATGILLNWHRLPGLNVKVGQYKAPFGLKKQLTPDTKLFNRAQPGDDRIQAGAPLFNTFEADGYYVTGSYFVIPKKLQLVTKWESFNPDQFANDNIHCIVAGVN